MRSCDLLACVQLVAEGYDPTEDDELYDELYEHFIAEGEMPYGIAKARSGDPSEWIYNQLETEVRYRSMKLLAARANIAIVTATQLPREFVEGTVNVITSGRITELKLEMLKQREFTFAPFNVTMP